MTLLEKEVRRTLHQAGSLDIIYVMFALVMGGPTSGNWECGGKGDTPRNNRTEVGGWGLLRLVLNVHVGINYLSGHMYEDCQFQDPTPHLRELTQIKGKDRKSEI